MMKEFRTFALRGNVIDLAVGVIIGAGFGKITTSLVNDVIMPPIYSSICRTAAIRVWPPPRRPALP